MIVMLALLNDGAILSIAYDNVRYKNAPESWNMRMVLGVATVLGVIGPIAAFGLFYLGDQIFHLSHKQLQPMMYLMLSVAGHLTIFLTRTRGPFWSIRPATILCIATGGTQILATFIAVYGFLMSPLGWKLAGFVWAYALIWALVSDRVKLLAYRIFDPVKDSAKPSDKDAHKPDSKTAPKPEAKAEPKPKPETKPESKESPKPEAKAEPKPETKPEGKETPKPEAKAEAKGEAKPESTDSPKPETNPESKPEFKDESKPEAKIQPKPEAHTPPEATPQLVKRVHELYEELGREDVEAVQRRDKANQDTKKDAPEAAHK
jgi:H+-transporting ATPase